MAVHVDTTEATATGKEVGHQPGSASSTIETYKPTLPSEMWAEVDATTFVVRGPGYITDKVKVRHPGRTIE
jgi:hypothetical protein